MLEKLRFPISINAIFLAYKAESIKQTGSLSDILLPWAGYN